MNSMNTSIANTGSEHLLARWQLPHPQFASGSDPRSSERGLLTLMYQSMDHAYRYQWLNGGRTLIDKTYLSILWAALELERPSISFDAIAANLDRFIRLRLAPLWPVLDELDHEQRHAQAVALVELAAQELFDSRPSEASASQLLFFLCPKLPFYPFSGAHAAGAGLDRAAGYADFHAHCRKHMAHHLPRLGMQPLPVAEQAPTIGPLLARGDWWQRRLMAQELVSLTLARAG